MKQRVTFIHKTGGGINPESLDIGQHGIKGPDLEAVREDRFTWGIDEIPNAFKELARDSKALHVRWVSSAAYTTVSPLISRVSPGLHIFYTPAKGQSANGQAICAAKTSIFGGDSVDLCRGNDNFVKWSTATHPQAPELHYYELIEDIAPFVDFMSQHCAPSDAACTLRASTLSTAAAIDISWDTTSESLKVTAQWPHGSHPLSVASTPGHRTEVGILGLDPSAQAEAHELGVSGALTVLDTGKGPSPVMFAFPTRHRQSGASFTSGFLPPTGLHPTLQLSLTGPRPPAGQEEGSCTLNAYFTLPKTIFADRYQLSDDLFLASKNLTALRHSTSPVDLEAPAYATKVWGSSILLELAPPARAAAWTAEVPLHLRYLAPNTEGYADISVPYPAVFWACDVGEGVEFPSTPFERANLGYDALFGPKTVFWHVEPRPRAGNRLLSDVRVPVLDVDDAPWVRVGTAAAVVLGFGWVLWVLVRAFLTTGHSRQTVSVKKTQ
ncbi:hypothetical protein BN1723_005115 [Verticillium longisporum]|uniref:Protein PBN1 n=1 Tax=Verticillium longisporum TaxID=100787 RepID=A0A0G4N4X4_VERLO|nr:Protein pbn1 like protein [Verticillium longisporum]CRK41399.1 hypothetical protein BN1723_005115 [Verticillium longisporum]